MEKNMINKEDLKRKINEIDLLMQKARTSLINMDRLIEETIDSKKGIWDGDEAHSFKKEYHNLSCEVPTVLDAFQKQTSNIKTLIEKDINN